MDLICPKCQASMRTYERNGVHVDQCSECRGIFLDRGELERLVDAEDAWKAGSSGQGSGAPETQDRPSAPQPAAAGGLGAIVGEVMSQARAAKQSSSSSHGGYGSHGQPHRKKSSSFLGELFG
ncbi:MAG: hypothetical protein JWN88_2137 [Frankiales bacterium]|jgi:Zn-finger nucleic acid-binding protein|nr:hypothetical protein [Frankiales bacterium]